MSTVDELLALRSAAAAAGYPTGLIAVPSAARPAVSVGPPTITPVGALCDHALLTAGVRVAGAGVTDEQLLDLVQAVDDVVTALSATDWTISTAAPDPLPDDTPAYTITVTKET